MINVATSDTYEELLCTLVGVKRPIRARSAVQQFMTEKAPEISMRMRADAEEPKIGFPPPVLPASKISELDMAGLIALSTEDGGPVVNTSSQPTMPVTEATPSQTTLSSGVFNDSTIPSTQPAAGPETPAHVPSNASLPSTEPSQQLGVEGDGPLAPLKSEEAEPAEWTTPKRKPGASINNREAVARLMFKELPKSEQDAYAERAKAKRDEDKRAYEERLREGPSRDPEDIRMLVLSVCSWDI